MSLQTHRHFRRTYVLFIIIDTHACIAYPTRTIPYHNTPCHTIPNPYTYIALHYIHTVNVIPRGSRVSTPKQRMPWMKPCFIHQLLSSHPRGEWSSWILWPCQDWTLDMANGFLWFLSLEHSLYKQACMHTYIHMYVCICKFMQTFKHAYL
jgi:hypothetical protein